MIKRYSIDAIYKSNVNFYGTLIELVGTMSLGISINLNPR